MSAARVIGGLFALFAGFLILIIVAIRLDYLSAGGAPLASWVINLLIGVLVLLGGLIGFGTRSTGGLVIVCAIISIILGILAAFVVDLDVLFSQYSTFQTYLTVGPWSGVTFEAILALIGGIFIAASGK